MLAKLCWIVLVGQYKRSGVFVLINVMTEDVLTCVKGLILQHRYLQLISGGLLDLPRERALKARPTGNSQQASGLCLLASATNPLLDGSRSVTHAHQSGFS